MNLTCKQVILFCADVKKLVHFYTECFGFSIIGTFDENWTVLDAGQVELAFHKIPPEHLPTPPGAFTVTDTNVKLVFETGAALSSFHEQLLAKGTDVGAIQQYPGYPFQVCDGRDPEGNVFQLRQLL
ncbi:VOC family protein [Panacibacter sp. DH6]|uniref:VOC family protein n=1 Tax=Panacibacter microcysteis TaxID=2793269 RepID=A0A931H042_9BACT|nr:VOC family protein [Panacibacter microcysteis]MBG9378541.1 VOC family protein [Panacibacter microcysteis]